MKNVGIAFAAVAAISIGSGCQTLADQFDPARPNINHHVRRATVRTEREMGQLALGLR